MIVFTQIKTKQAAAPETKCVEAITKTDDSRAVFFLIGSGWSLFKLNLSNQREM